MEAKDLADLIETRLLGIEPDEQDVVLEDSDWRVIVAALRLSPSPDTVVVGREEIARIVDPGVIHPRNRLSLRGAVAERSEYKWQAALAKADTILALSSLPVEGGE